MGGDAESEMQNRGKGERLKNGYEYAVELLGLVEWKWRKLFECLPSILQKKWKGKRKDPAELLCAKATHFVMDQTRT